MRSLDAHSPRSVNDSGNGCLAARGQEMSVRILFNMSLQPSRWASEFLMRVSTLLVGFIPKDPRRHPWHRHTLNTKPTTHIAQHTTHDTRHTVHRTQHTAHNAQHNTHTHIKQKTGRHGQPHNRICCTIRCKSVLSFEQEAAVRRGLSRHRAKDVSATIELVLQRLLARLLHQTAGTNISLLLMLDVHDPRLTLTPYWRWLFVPLSPLTSDCQKHQCTRRRSCCCLCGTYRTTCTSMAVCVPLTCPCN